MSSLEMTTEKRKDATIMDIQYDLVSHAVKGEPIQPLQQLAANKIAIILLTQIYKNIVELPYDNPILTPTYPLLLPFWNSKIDEIFLSNFPSLTLTKICEELVDEAFDKVGGEVNGFFNHLYSLKWLLNAERIKIYLSNIMWKHDATIDYIETSLALVENPNLTTIEKYALACSYCLKDKLKELMQQLPKDFYNDFVGNDNFILMMFWTFRLRRNVKGFYNVLKVNETSKRNIYKYLLILAIKSNNEVAVQYIWETFFNKSMKNSIVPVNTCTLVDNRENMLVYLLSQVKQPNQFRRLFIESGGTILKMLANDPKWQTYFFRTSERILEFLNEMKFCRGVKTILLCWKKTAFKRKKYEMMLKTFIQKHGVDIESNFIFSCKTILPMVLSVPVMNEEKKVMKQLLKIENKMDGYKFLRKDSSVFNLLHYFEDDEQKIFVSFIHEFLSENEMLVFKTHIFKKYGFKICFELIFQNGYEATDCFLRTFCPKEKISAFKHDFPYAKEGKFIGTVLNLNIKDVYHILAFIDKFLNWSFENNEKEIVQCKMILFDLENDVYSFCNKSFLERFLNLEKSDNQEMNILLKWAFVTDENISKYKMKLTMLKK